MEHERAKSVSSLRLSEHFAKLAPHRKHRAAPGAYESLGLDARLESGDTSAADTFDEVKLEEGTVTGRAPAHSWPTMPPAKRQELPVGRRPSLTDVIEADLVLGGSKADGDLLRAIANRLSVSHSSSKSSFSMRRSMSHAGGTHSRDSSSQSIVSRVSKSLRGTPVKSSADATKSMDKTPAEPTTCRYCLETMDPSENCSTCHCTGPLCKSCLRGELQLTFSRGHRVMHCTVCRDVFNISNLQEVPLPKARFPRCHDARGGLMSFPVFVPVFLWTVFTSVYSFVDPGFEVIRGDVFFIAELAIMAFSLHFCWRSREPLRSWMRALYAMRALRSAIVILAWQYTWIDTIFLIFSLIFLMGSCLRNPDKGVHEGEFSLDVWVNDIGPLRLEASDEWTVVPTHDIIRRNQEAAAADREVQVAHQRLGEVIEQERNDLRDLGRFLGFGSGRERDDSISMSESQSDVKAYARATRYSSGGVV